MPPIESIIAVTLAGLALSVTPGPSMLYVVSRAVGQSRAAGFASAVGLGIGGIILAVATALGLAVVFESFDWIPIALRWVGSIYLVWLGIGLIREAGTTAHFDIEAKPVRQMPLGQIVWQGVVIEVLNPKTVLFFALFLPPFVDVGTAGEVVPNVQLQFLVLGILVPLTAVPSDVVLALFASRATELVSQKQSSRLGLAWVGGAMLIVIAVNLHLGLF